MQPDGTMDSTRDESSSFCECVYSAYTSLLFCLCCVALIKFSSLVSCFCFSFFFFWNTRRDFFFSFFWSFHNRIAHVHAILLAARTKSVGIANSAVCTELKQNKYQKKKKCRKRKKERKNMSLRNPENQGL